MTRLVFAVIFALSPLASLTAAAQAPAVAAAPVLPGAITVTGTGRIFVKPDIARLSLGVTEERASAAAALQVVAERLEAALATLRGAGIPPADIRTTQIVVGPVVEYGETGPLPVSRYQASSSVEVTLRDLSEIGRLLDAATGAGANTVGGIAFDLQDRSAALDEARRAAVADAAARAELYADAAGLELGPLRSIAEAQAQMPMPLMQEARMMDMAAGSALPVAPGEIEITAEVTLVYGF